MHRAANVLLFFLQCGGRLFSTAKIRRFPEGSARNSICSRITSPRPIYRPFLNEFWVERAETELRGACRLELTSRDNNAFSRLSTEVLYRKILSSRRNLFLGKHSINNDGYNLYLILYVVFRIIRGDFLYPYSGIFIFMKLYMVFCL